MTPRIFSLWTQFGMLDIEKLIKDEFLFLQKQDEDSDNKGVKRDNEGNQK